MAMMCAHYYHLTFCLLSMQIYVKFIYLRNYLHKILRKNQKFSVI